MIEAQRLQMERELATARRALYRAQEVAERGAYYGLNDIITGLNLMLGEVMEAVIRGQESVSLQLDLCTYLCYNQSSDRSSATSKPVRAG